MLTQKQENFAQAMVKGYTRTEAYRSSYNAENMLDATCVNEAYRLLRKHEVATRIEELRELLALKTLFPLSERLSILKDIAKAGEKEAARVSAIKVATDIIGDGAASKKDVKAIVETNDITIRGGLPTDEQDDDDDDDDDNGGVTIDEWN